MVTIKFDETDGPVCPLMGLVNDARSHFTYPHPGHRCFAEDRPATADASGQATYCLSTGYATCDRYRAWNSKRSSPL